MIRFADASLRSKLTVLMAVSTTLALIVAAGALSAYEVITFRRALVQKLTTVADIVGRNSTAAIAFGDRSVARDILTALETEPAIEGGVVFDGNGQVFATYGGATGGALPTAPQEPGARFEGNHLVVVRPIILDDERVGTVYVRATLNELTSRLLFFAAMMLGIVTVSSAMGLLASTLLQRKISQPILDLGETARLVTSDRNFSLRAAAGGRDEIGILVEDFNRMLAEIERQDQQLREQQNQLTAEVANRTAELVASNEQLTKSVRRVEHYADQIAQLTELGQLLQSCVTCEEVFGVVRQAMERLFPQGSGALTLLRPSGNLLETMAMWGRTPPAQRVYGPDDCWAFRRGRPHLVSDPASPLRCAHLMPTEGPVTFCVPMMAQGDTVGVLQFIFEAGEEPDIVDTSGDVHSTRGRLAIALAEHIGLALANIRLREALRSQSIIDALTGLYNRRYLENVLERECRRAVRAGRALAVLMLDVDQFKRFNDTWGHEGGDAVLRDLASLLRSSFRGDDVACRYGGEEFVVVLAETAPAAAFERAEQLRLTIAALQAQHRGQAMGAITVSIGVATLPEQGSTPDELIAAADRALYAAKQAGRNRTVLASSGPRAEWPSIRPLNPTRREA